MTGNGATNDFASWVGNSSCGGVTKSTSAGVVTFSYGAVPTGTKQCNITVAPTYYQTFNNAQITITPTISGSNFASSTGAAATLTATAAHSDELFKNAPVTVTSGLPFTYVLRFYCGGKHDDSGDIGLSALTITDPLPESFTYTSHETPKSLPQSCSAPARRSPTPTS